MTLIDLKTSDLLDRIASRDPTPGGGSAAALAGAVAAALVAMVASMPKTRSGSEEERQKLDGVLVSATSGGEVLRRLVDDDAQAFDAVLAARRLPKGTADEKARRQAAVDAATRQASEVPLRTAEACLQVLRAATGAAMYGNANARSDAVTAAALAWAGLLGGVENVRINLESVPDEAAAARIAELAAAGREALNDIGLD